MNTKIKIATGMIAGLVAGATLMGAVIAAPQTREITGLNGYGMMRSFVTSGTFDLPTIAEMNSFMNRYRTSSGSIDVNRMHADVTSGKVTAPCLNGSSGAKGASTGQAGRTPARRGPAMMGGSTSNGGPVGYGMMGSTY